MSISEREAVGTVGCGLCCWAEPVIGGGEMVVVCTRACLVVRAIMSLLLGSW